MKKIIITRIAIIACVALCASVWPQNAEDELIEEQQLDERQIAELTAQEETEEKTA